VTGAELAQRAYQQAWVFGARFLLMSEVVSLRTDGRRHVLCTADGVETSARTVVLATGATYRRLAVPEIEELVEAGVYYGAGGPEAAGVAEKRVFVLGGGNSAGQAAMHLARYASAVTLLVRGDSLAASMSQYLRKQIDENKNIELRFNTEVVGASGDGQLEALTLRDRLSGEEETAPAAGLFVLIGNLPHTDWLPPTIARDDYGYVPTGSDIGADDGWPLARTPFTYETTLPGVFAVGDVNHASNARVASAVGEGSAVIRRVHELLVAPDPDDEIGSVSARSRRAS
jgi:thioredoxin reductase (NADPH)